MTRVALPVGNAAPNDRVTVSSASSYDTPATINYEICKQFITNVTDFLQLSVDKMCNDFDVPLFWDEVYLKNRIK